MPAIFPEHTQTELKKMSLKCCTERRNLAIILGVAKFNMLNIVMMSVAMVSFGTLSVAILSIVILSVTMLSILMLSIECVALLF
jgi:hypothetical protein